MKVWTTCHTQKKSILRLTKNTQLWIPGRPRTPRNLRFTRAGEVGSPYPWTCPFLLPLFIITRRRFRITSHTAGPFYSHECTKVRTGPALSCATLL